MTSRSVNSTSLLDPEDFTSRTIPVNSAPRGFDPANDLPKGFLEFLAPLHDALTHRQRSLIAQRDRALGASHQGRHPDYLPPSEATTTPWRIELPEWCADQRNQMTGPADDAELVVKMLNSGAPGVMLDLEDSTANLWDHILGGIQNILKALTGQLSYHDKKRSRTVEIKPGKTVIFTRPRGLHLHQAGVLGGELLPASLFDVAMIAFQVDYSALKHPLTFYIPKTESADEALWWRDLFQMAASAKGLPAQCLQVHGARRVPPARLPDGRIRLSISAITFVGLNLGRWDYMASLIHFNIEQSRVGSPGSQHHPAQCSVLPKSCASCCRDLPQARHARHRRHDRALPQPRRRRTRTPARLAALAEDKKNEAMCGMDGAWTGHPDQNEIAVNQFPFPNQIAAAPRHGRAAIPESSPAAART